MALKPKQLKTLLALIASAEPDSLDCDDCGKYLAEFAEAHLLGKELAESQQAVQTHLQNCHCCQSEFEQLLVALENLEESQEA